MKPLLEHNNIEINLTHNERKPGTAKEFIGTIKITIYKNMAAVSKNVYIDKLDKIVDKCNSTYRRTKKILNLSMSNYVKPTLNLMLKTMIKTLNLKLVIMSECFGS